MEYFLFFSLKCKLCNIVLSFIKQNNLRNINLIKIDDNLKNIPKNIKTVPSLILKYQNNKYQVITGNKILEYLKELTNKEDNIKPFNYCEMCLTSDLYSYCNNNPNELNICSSSFQNQYFQTY